MEVAGFTFNDFAENTYVLYDDSKSCVIIDPGCNTDEERKQLTDFIGSYGLKPEALINTHCHIDHVLGNQFIHATYRLELHAHKDEQVVLDSTYNVAKMYGIPYESSPPITQYLNGGDTFTFGESQLKVLFTPGHSPASISLYHEPSNQLIAGDVLFNGSIGRTDLPGGDYDTLISNIKTKFLPLGDDVKVYSGHGPVTTIGDERKNNPFLQD